VGDTFKWLKEGAECEVITWNGRVLGVELPASVVLKVTDTDPGVRGDTAQGELTAINRHSISNMLF
jgi:elongation factor P